MEVLFLIQSCNEERYIKEEQILRETYLKRLRKGCCYYFYRGNGNNTLSGDTLLLDCEDDLNHTFKKTMMALSVFKNKGYDFIVRLNTSNWINMELLFNLLETLNSSKRELIGGKALKNGTTKGIPILRGNLLIINKTIMNDLFESTKKKYDSGIDDVLIGLNLFSYYKEIGVEYLNVLKNISYKAYSDITNITNKDIENTICIRLVDKIKKDGNSEVIREIDNRYIQSKLEKCCLEKIKYVETYHGDKEL